MILLAGLVRLAHAQALVEGKGKDVTEKICNGCHAADVVTTYRNSKDDWQSVIDDMKGRGADGSDADFNAIVAYLAKYYGPEITINKATAADLQTQMEITADEAAAIVQYRKDHGDFKTADDLKKVAGLDMKKIEPIEQRIVFQ